MDRQNVLELSLRFLRIASIIIGVSERNRIMKNKNKKSNPNRIKCQITGVERISNKTYLANKGEKNGVTGNVWASFYVSKPAFNELVEHVSDFGFKSTCAKYEIDNDRLKKWLRFNGRGSFVKIAKNIQLDVEENTAHAVQVSVEDAAVALELATAEIERTKEQLIDKNETSDRDRKLARRRELYAEKKRTALSA